MGRFKFSTGKLCEYLQGTAIATGGENFCSYTSYFKAEWKRWSFQKTLKQFMAHNHVSLFTDC